MGKSHRPDRYGDRHDNGDRRRKRREQERDDQFLRDHFVVAVVTASPPCHPPLNLNFGRSVR